MPTLKSGIKAYYDAFTGLVPCKVLAVNSDYTRSSGHLVSFEVTAKRPGYKLGERLSVSSLFVVPREAVYVKDHQYKIGGYNVITD